MSSAWQQGNVHKGQFTLRVTFPFRHSSIFVPSERFVFTLSVMFIHLPEQYVIEDLRLFPSNMQPYSFSKRQLAATTLMLDEEEKNAAPSDKKKHMWVHNFFRSRNSKGKYWTEYKELV
jgi:hypothetical protein